MPEVEDQHDARSRAAIPRFALVRVVEHDDTPLLPMVDLATHAAGRSLPGTSQRQVRHEARVRHPRCAVRCVPGVNTENRTLRRVLTDPRRAAGHRAPRWFADSGCSSPRAAHRAGRSSNRSSSAPRPGPRRFCRSELLRSVNTRSRPCADGNRLCSSSQDFSACVIQRSSIHGNNDRSTYSCGRQIREVRNVGCCRGSG